MKNKILIARVLLGGLFVVFGLNGFLNFMPMPPMPEAAGEFLGALAKTGYMFPLIKGVEVIGGLMVLANFCVPLALILLAPGMVNFILFHIFLAPAGLPVPLILAALELFLAWNYRETYRALFK